MGSPLLLLLLLLLLLPLFPMSVVVPRPTRQVWLAWAGSVRGDRGRTTAQRAAGGGSEYPLHARVEGDSRILGILEGVHRWAGRRGFRSKRTARTNRQWSGKAEIGDNIKE